MCMGGAHRCEVLGCDLCRIGHTEATLLMMPLQGLLQSGMPCGKSMQWRERDH